MYESGKSDQSDISEARKSENILDKWVLSLLSKTHQDVTKYLDAYDTVRVGKALTDFINDLSTWYLRRSRDRIKNGGEDLVKVWVNSDYRYTYGKNVSEFGERFYFNEYAL